MNANAKTAPRFDLGGGVPILGFTGVNGTGKTLLAVQTALCDLARGRALYSTVDVASKWGDSIPIRSLGQLARVRDATILLDEVSVMLSSRSTHTLPPEIVTLLQVVRHHNNRVLWTAPEWMRADSLLRGVTQAVVTTVPFIRSRVDGSPWPRPIVGMASLLDTSTGAPDSAPTRVLRRRFFLPSRLDSWGTYDTRADVTLLANRDQGGTCPDCGGTRAREKCTPERHYAMELPFYEG